MFGSEKALPPPTTGSAQPPSGNPPPAAGVQSDEEAKKKKSFFGKIVGAFKGDSGSSNQNDKNAPAPPKSGNSGTPPP
jgi:hypothetical protein